MKAYIAALLALIAGATCAPAEASDQVSGQGIAVDGDTVAIRGQQFAIWGIKTPDISTASGERARRDLADLVAGRTVTCIPMGEWRGGEQLANCFVGSRSLAEEMQAEGWASNYTRPLGERSGETDGDGWEDAPLTNGSKTPEAEKLIPRTPSQLDRDPVSPRDVPLGEPR